MSTLKVEMHIALVFVFEYFFACLLNWVKGIQGDPLAGFSWNVQYDQVRPGFVLALTRQVKAISEHKIKNFYGQFISDSPQFPLVLLLLCFAGPSIRRFFFQGLFAVLDRVSLCAVSRIIIVPVMHWPSWKICSKSKKLERVWSSK